MNTLQSVLDENISYYKKIKKEIVSRLACLPKGSIKSKIIGQKKYYYLQFRKNGKVIQKYLGKTIPKEILKNLKERKAFEKEMKEVEASLKLLRVKTDTSFILPVKEILYVLARAGLWEEGIELIGSWAFRLYQEHFGVSPFPLRSDDLDFAISLPYLGKEAHIPELLKEIGFREGFNLDGSIYFYRPGLRVEFLVPKKGRNATTLVKIKKLSLSAQPLRFLDILLDEPAEIKISKKLRIKIPSLSAFLIHKLIIFQRRWEKADASKDLQQIIAVAKTVVTEKEERKRISKIWASIPNGWKNKVIKGIEIGMKELAHEENTWIALKNLLFTLQSN